MTKTERLQAESTLDGIPEMAVASLAAGFVHRTVMHKALVDAGLSSGRLSTQAEMEAANSLSDMIAAARLIESNSGLSEPESVDNS